MKQMDIVVLAGGLSPERDVSFVTGREVSKALRGKGHRVLMTDLFLGFGKEGELPDDVFERSEELSYKADFIPETAPDLDAVRASREDQSPSLFGPNVIAVCRKADVVFMALHGASGEDGRIQAAFDLYGIRYTGSGYLSSAISMDKGVAKSFMTHAGVPVPEGIVIRWYEDAKERIHKEMQLPYVIKPLSGGSSIGVSIVREESELEPALAEAKKWDREFIVERYIKAREFAVCVIKGEALPVIEIAPKTGFYDYKNKYKAGSTVETCPADIPEEKTKEMQRYACLTAGALGLHTYSRMDFLMDDEGRLYCLEANTLPGMTPTSLIPQEAAAKGVSFPDLCEKLIEVSLEEK